MIRNLIFLHGFLGCPEDWQEVIEQLNASFHCYALPLPLKLQIFIEQLNQLGIKKCALVGYSMGGRVALQLQKQYPLHISQLVLLGAHLGLKDASDQEKRGQIDFEWIQQLRSLPLEEFLQRWYSQPLFKDFIIPKRRSQIDPYFHAELLETYSLAKQPYLEPPLDTLFLCGEKDHKYQILYQDRVPVLIPDAGHAAHLENPAAVARALNSNFR